jgi:hypothetical protein
MYPTQNVSNTKCIQHKMHPAQNVSSTKYVLHSLQLFFQRFFASANLYRVTADIRALMRLALQVQFPILPSDYDQNDKCSTAVRRYYMPHLMAVRSTILDHYMRTDRSTGRF